MNRGKLSAALYGGYMGARRGILSESLYLIGASFDIKVEFL